MFHKWPHSGKRLLAAFQITSKILFILHFQLTCLTIYCFAPTKDYEVISKMLFRKRKLILLKEASKKTNIIKLGYTPLVGILCKLNGIIDFEQTAL